MLINPSVIKQYLVSRVQNQQEHFTHPPFQLEQQLLEALRFGDDERACMVLRQINQLQGATLAPYPVRARKNSLIAACTLFTRAMIAGGVPPELAFHLSDAYILEIEKLSDIYNLEKLEYEMLQHFAKTVREERALPVYSRPVRLALAYVYENILLNPSLEAAAAAAGVHPNYLSSCFKQELGLTWTDFVNRKRIEESQYFLLHTSYPISEIALLFQFCNQSYYTVLFKRHTGMTPREFRSREKVQADRLY